MVTMAAERVREYLREQGVEFETQTHDLAVTAQRVAAAEHESGWHIAKPVLLMADGDLVMAVLPAPLLVDLDKAADALGADEVRLADEGEFAPRFEDCDTGAEPVFGNLYDVPVVVDERLTQEPRMRFAAGSHTETIEVAVQDYLRLVDPRTAPVGIPSR
jgi:Ala-tRNA(Pro) deacylase